MVSAGPCCAGIALQCLGTVSEKTKDNFHANPFAACRCRMSAKTGIHTILCPLAVGIVALKLLNATFACSILAYICLLRQRWTVTEHVRDDV